MFKKFFYISSLSIFLISYIFSFSSNNLYEYCYPIKNNYISSHFGKRYLFNRYQYHNGIDIPAISYTNIYSISNGIVQYIGFDSNGYGNYMIILYNNGYKSLYGHLDETNLVNVGDKVIIGQTVAKVGNKILSNGRLNGSTTGPHLHFTVYDNNNNLIDPLSLTYKK